MLEYTGATPQPLVRAQQPELGAITGDGDAYLEPGESATLRLPVTNVGDGTATGISVTATPDDPLAVLTPRNRNYGDLPAGATTSRDFTLALDDDYPLGKRVRIAIRVTFAGVLSPTNATFMVATGQPATTPVRFAYTGPPVPIPDASTLGASVTIPVTGVGYASKITFAVDGTTCTEDPTSTTVGINHSYVGDLTGTLTSPAGTAVQVFARNGTTGENLCQVVFDDAAARAFATVLSGDDPFTGHVAADPAARAAAERLDGGRLDVQGHRLGRRRHGQHPRGVAIDHRVRGGLTGRRRRRLRCCRDEMTRGACLRGRRP